MLQGTNLQVLKIIVPTILRMDGWNKIINSVILLYYYIKMRHRTANISYKHNDGNATDIEEHVAVIKKYHYCYCQTVSVQFVQLMTKGAYKWWNRVKKSRLFQRHCKTNAFALQAWNLTALDTM
jgi:hypothetical protein